jgi:hypothetical protein
MAESVMLCLFNEFYQLIMHAGLHAKKIPDHNDKLASRLQLSASRMFHVLRFTTGGSFVSLIY